MKAVGNKGAIKVVKSHFGPFLRPDAHQRYFSRNESFIIGSNSRYKPSYRHPHARVPMLSMVKYSCTVQLFRTAVLCHVINRIVTSSDTSSQERVDKTTRKI